MSAKVEGMPKLRAALLRVTGEAERTTQREVRRAALNVQNGAKRRATTGIEPGPNVQTGRLRNSIAHELGDDGLNATIGTNVEYAPYVEFGTSRSRPYPYLFPAFEEERPQFLSRLRRELGAAFVRAAD